MRPIIYLLLLQLLLSHTTVFPQYVPDFSGKKEPVKTVYPTFRNYGSFGVHYEMGLPNAQMRKGMNTVHGVQLTGAMPLNFISRNLEAGLNFGYGIYAIENFGLQYRMGNNFVNTNIQYSSSMLQGGAMVNYYFNRTKKLQPFVGVRAGYAEVFTSFFIEDPRDPTACIALESDVVQSDGTFTYGLGTGARWFLGSGLGAPRTFLEFSASWVQGGNINYVNANSIAHHSAPPPTQQSGSNGVNVNFVNPTTNDVHKHSIAEVHNSDFRMLQMRLSYIMHFSRRR